MSRNWSGGGDASSPNMAHRIAEKTQSRPLRRHPTLPRPCVVLKQRDEALGVWHQSEDQAAGIAYAGDVVDAAVWIVGEPSAGGSAGGGGVGQRDLAVAPQGPADRVVGRDNIA